MNTKSSDGRNWNGWRIALWGGAASLLLLPLVAMQFTDEVNWDETDFIVMGALLGSAVLGVEFLVRRSNSLFYTLGSLLAVLASFLLVWANLAVGMIGSEDNNYNLLFGGVIAIAALGAVVGRFRADGMARAMIVAGLAQILVAAGGLSADPRGGVLSMILAGLWLLAALLFRQAARKEVRAGVAA